MRDRINLGANGMNCLSVQSHGNDNGEFLAIIATLAVVLRVAFIVAADQVGSI
jgi:hypothetical protein